MATNKTILERLAEVQASLKAPKGQYNSFGKYSYRSAEDILEAVKPLLHDNGLVLLITDTVEEIGGRVYVKATGRLLKTDGGNELEVSAYAREALERKGMDESQVTGSASSYARKYMLNGLFAIDDTKDADTMDNRDRGQTTNRQPPGSFAVDTITEKQAKRLFAISKGRTDTVKDVLDSYGYKSSLDIKRSDYEAICADVEKSVDG